MSAAPTSGCRNFTNKTAHNPPMICMTTKAGTDDGAMPRGEIDYDKFEQPAVARTRSRIASASAGSFDASEIPAFLRKQAD